MRKLSFATTKKEIKKELEFLKIARGKIKWFGPMDLKTVESEITRLTKELEEITE